MMIRHVSSDFARKLATLKTEKFVETTGRMENAFLPERAARAIETFWTLAT